LQGRVEDAADREADTSVVGAPSRHETDLPVDVLVLGIGIRPLPGAELLSADINFLVSHMLPHDDRCHVNTDTASSPYTHQHWYRSHRGSAPHRVKKVVRYKVPVVVGYGNPISAAYR